jgi:hypothetical protein
MKVMKATRLFMVAGFALCIFISASPGGAELVTSLPDGTIIRMPELDYEGCGPKTFGPDNSVTWSSTFPLSVFGGTQGAYFNTNGLWLVLAVVPWMGPIAVLQDASHTMTFEFSKPVQAVGGFLNYSYYPTRTNFSIAVYDSSHTLIEDKTLSFTTDGGYNQGFFYGFQEASNKIRYFTLTGSVIGITNLTTVTGPESPVILPPYLLLLE